MNQTCGQITEQQQNQRRVRCDDNLVNTEKFSKVTFKSSRSNDGRYPTGIYG